MNLTFPVIPVDQNVGTFYVSSISAKSFFNICRFDYRRIQERGGYKDFLGIQRPLNEKRVKDIKKYITTVDAVFPTSIVISVDDRCALIEEKNGVSFMTLSEYIDPEDNNLVIEFEDIATIIDGQHRLKSFDDFPEAKNFDVSVSIFVGIDDATEASIFSKVNLAQTKVNRSLAYDLFSLERDRSPEKTCHEVVVALDKMEDSPFYQRIKRLGTATEGRFGETLSQATIVRGILPYITNDPLSDQDVGKRIGYWDPIDPRQLNKRIFFEFFRRNEDEKILLNIRNFFAAVRERWPQAWESTGRGNMLNRTNGFNGLIRFLRPAYLYYTETPVVVRMEEYISLFQIVDLNDGDFNPERFIPGSSGATKLYHTLIEQTGVARI